MNREQAGNILDAYVLLSTTKTKAASDALREVILDAMTEYRYYPLTISRPYTSPTNAEPFKQPYVTWTTETAASGPVCINGCNE